MKVEIKLFGTLRRFSSEGRPGIWSGEVSDGITVKELIGIIGTSERETAFCSIDGRVVPFDSLIPRGAEIKLVTRMGAG